MSKRALDIRALAELPGPIGTACEVPAGTRLFTQGSSADEVYLIREGVVKSLWTDFRGSEVITGLRWPGGLLGSESVIVDIAHSATAYTLTRCALERIGRTRFLELLTTNQQFSLYVLRVQSDDVIEQINRVGELACIPSELRLKNLLVQLLDSTRAHGANASERHIALPMKRKELASILAVTPEHLSRLLRKFVAAGAISIVRGMIVIEQAGELQQPASRAPDRLRGPGNAPPARPAHAG